MKNPVFTPVTALMLFLASIQPAFSQIKPQNDIYGREILNSHGEKINYSKTDPAATQSLKVEALYEKAPAYQESNILKDTMVFGYKRLYTLMGTCIGRNSMHSIDINNDGIIELICTASSQYYGMADYWYVLHYNSTDSTCEQIWTSPDYGKNITCLEVNDINDDGSYEILVGFENGSINIYNAKMDLIRESRPVSESINSIMLGDADNDASKEIVISTDNNIFLVNAQNWTVERTISQGADYVRTGNVNSDSMNEIVLSSGSVYQINGTQQTKLWNFISDMEGYVELSDIDNDSRLEIVYAQSWDYINVYDADTRTKKYSISSDLDIQALLLQDVNHDGIDEILYGDGQWGEVYCYNAVTQNKMWSVVNPEHGVTAINYADLDNDGKEELIWAAGWTSTGPDYLYIYSVPESRMRWQSEDVVGPFYAMATGDIDGDGNTEIVAVSDESESGYASGIIFIFDAGTGKLKWQSTGNFLYGIWTGIHNVIIKDIDNDSFNEIIIAAGQAYTGTIWIIDGKNHVVKSSHVFGIENLTEFYALAVEDIDNDSNNEIIALSSSNVYVINPEDWSVKWKQSVPGNYDRVIKCGDINGDGLKEFVICNGSLHIINSADHSVWTSSEMYYSNIDLFDIDRDGIQDIIASGKFGYITVIDGKTKQEKSKIRPEMNEISSVRLLEYNDSNLYIYSCDGRINYYLNDSKCMVSQYFGKEAGQIEGLQIFEQSDSSTLLLGTNISIIEISAKTLNCADFTVEVAKSEVSCDKDDGRIVLHTSGGKAPYSFLWNNGSVLDSLVNLGPANLSVNIHDNAGCSIKRTINILRSYIGVSVNVTDAGCNSNGSAHIDLTHINAPYTITWSNSQTGPELLNVPPGEYGVMVKDSKNCTFQDTVAVLKDTVIINAHIQNVLCHGLKNGSVYLETIKGESPLTYEWDTESNGNQAYNLAPGTYGVKITDALGCITELNLVVTEPDEISYDVMISPDDITTPNWEGALYINNIAGGKYPYQVYWPMFSVNSAYMGILPPGNYEFILLDANECAIKDTGTVVSYDPTPTGGTETELLNVYPNPARYELFIGSIPSEFKEISLLLINSNGQVVKSLAHSGTGEARINLAGVAPGVYTVFIQLDQSVFVKKIVVE